MPLPGPQAPHSYKGDDSRSITPTFQGWEGASWGFVEEGSLFRVCVNYVHQDALGREGTLGPQEHSGGHPRTCQALV